MKVYTLRHENIGALQHLNGKMFTIKIDGEGRMTLFDVITKDWLRRTTRLVQSKETLNGVIYVTESGTVYDLIDVATILPSNQEEEGADWLRDIFKTQPDFHNTEILDPVPEIKPKKTQEKVVDDVSEDTEEPKEPEAINIDDIPEVLDEFNINRDIYYGDGYYGIVYSFTSEVNYEQFIRFCKAKGMKVPREKGYTWYEDHPMVFNQRIINGERHPNKGASERDTSPVWTWLWVRAYTD